MDGADSSVYWADRLATGGVGGSGSFSKKGANGDTHGTYALDVHTRQPVGPGHPAVLFSDLAHSTRAHSGRDALAARRARAGDGVVENGSYFSIADTNEARELLAAKFERLAAELEAAGEKRVARRHPRPLTKKRR